MKVVQVLSRIAIKKQLTVNLKNEMRSGTTRLGDPLRFKQILFNLIGIATNDFKHFLIFILGNSIKFTPEKGSIVLYIFDDVAKGKQFVSSFAGWGKITERDIMLSPRRVPVKKAMLVSPRKSSDKEEVKVVNSEKKSEEEREPEEEQEADDVAASIFVAVEDTGVGMSADAAEFLFKSYSQVDSSIGRKFGGTGMKIT